MSTATPEKNDPNAARPTAAEWAPAASAAGAAPDPGPRPSLEERRRVAEQIAQVKKMETLGLLASGIAHDLNNILTAIISHTEIATELIPAPNPALENLLHVKQASRRATELVQRILAFSARGPQARQNLELGSVVSDVTALLRASIPASVKIELSLEPTDRLVQANATDLQQVVLNLGSNAAYAMREHGGVLGITLQFRRVREAVKTAVGALAPGDYLHLCVADTGTGIPDEVRARMFEPFFTTKARGDGTGLGLSIVLGIVSNHGGTLDVHSTPGQGTRFDIYLPAVTAAQSGEGDEEPRRVSGSGQRLAFVDDEAAITEAARISLRHHGYRPSTFSRARALLDHYSSGGEPFQLIITDQMMPEMTGMEMIRALRANGIHAPIIILSGNARFVAAEELAPLGQVQFMPKPFDTSSLLERITVMLALSA